MSASKKRDSIYEELSSKLTSANLQYLGANISDINIYGNSGFVNVRPINEYLKKLKTTLESIKVTVKKEKNDTAQKKSRSLKILDELLKLIKTHSSASENFLNDAEALSKKLKKIGRLNFFGSFGASLNYGKSIKFLNSCGFFLGEAIKRARLRVTHIRDFSSNLTKKMDDIGKSSNIKAAQKAFNKVVEGVQSQWIFNDNSDSILTFDPPTNQDSTTWKLERISGTNKETVKKNLVSQLTTLNNIIEKDNTSRYSDEFRKKVSNVLNHVSSLDRYC